MTPEEQGQRNVAYRSVCGSDAGLKVLDDMERHLFTESGKKSQEEILVYAGMCEFYFRIKRIVQWSKEKPQHGRDQDE